jgi:hypothetical protein
VPNLVTANYFNWYNFLNKISFPFFVDIKGFVDVSSLLLFYHFYLYGSCSRCRSLKPGLPVPEPQEAALIFGGAGQFM